MSLIVSLVSGKHIFFCKLYLFVIPLKWIFWWVTIIKGRNKSNTKIQMTLRYETWIQAYFLFEKKKRISMLTCKVCIANQLFPTHSISLLKEKKRFFFSFGAKYKNRKLSNHNPLTILLSSLHKPIFSFYFIYFFSCLLFFLLKRFFFLNFKA